MVKTLQKTKYSVDEKLNQSFIQLFRGAAPTVSASRNEVDGNEESEEEDGSSSEEENGNDFQTQGAPEITEEREFQNGRLRRKVMFSKDLEEEVGN